MPCKIPAHLSHYGIMKRGRGSQSAESDLLPWQCGSSSALTQVSLEADRLSGTAENYLFATAGFLLQRVLAAIAGLAGLVFSS